VLLKDVFDHSLEEIAELVDSTVGGVKAALNRGRAKLAAMPVEPSTPPRAKTPDSTRLLHLYVERFNRRDWDGLRELIADDARLRVADRFVGPLTGAPYFARYARRTTEWRMASGEVDGDLVVLALQRSEDGWTPHAIVRLEVSDNRIVDIVDYTHCPWMIPAAASVAIHDELPS
jgi:RNA polymerase sigma-70 factor (ECF subfamily)